MTDVDNKATAGACSRRGRAAISVRMTERLRDHIASGALAVHARLRGLQAAAMQVRGQRTAAEDMYCAVTVL